MGLVFFFGLSTGDIAVSRFVVTGGGFHLVVMVTLLVLEKGSVLQRQPWTSFQLGFMGFGSFHPLL